MVVSYNLYVVAFVEVDVMGLVTPHFIPYMKFDLLSTHNLA